MPSNEMKRILARAHAESEKVLKQTEPLSQMREKLEAATAAQRLPGDVGFEDVSLGGVAAVQITPPAVTSDVTWLFFHGGAYVKGCVPASHLALVGLCRALGARGLSVDYRIAPENPFPAALEDAMTVYRHLLDTGYRADRIAVSGSSAGGGLALALLIALRDAGLPQPLALVPVAPWADLTQSGESMVTRAERDPALTKPYLDRFAKDYVGTANPRDPRISPVFADYTGIETAILAQVGSEEILFDDSARVVEKARAAGVVARLEETELGFHGWQNHGPALPEAVAAAESAAAFVREAMAARQANATGVTG